MGNGTGSQSHLQMDVSHLWQAVLGDLQVRLTRTAFDNWLRQTSLIGIDGDTATVVAENTFTASTLQARYASQVEHVLGEMLGHPVRVHFAVKGRVIDDARAVGSTDDSIALGRVGTRSVFNAPPPSTHRARRGPARSATHGTAPEGQSKRAARSDPPHAEQAGARQIELAATPTHGLNPRYVYDTYVVGSGNRFAHAASLSVAEHPGGKYNPFFVHGGVGLGKTHLLHAVGHRALELEPDLNIVYVSSEKFTNDLIDSIRKQRMEEFRSRYRTIDILMIDDIQFIAGKESTQEEFFHTFNALYQSGKQVIITSDKPPKAISSLEDRLRSRFEGGLITDVQLPDYEMRTAILRAKGEELRISLPADVIEYVAQRDQSNIRELEGALNKVIFRAQITGEPISLPLAMEALTDAAVGARRTQTTPSKIIDAVADHFGVSLKDLRGRQRTKEIVLPRQIAMYLLREELELPHAEIGKHLGGRDHTTVMHGTKQIERALTSDANLRSQILTIREAIFSASAT